MTQSNHTDERAEIRDAFCSLSDLLDRYAAGRAESVPRCFRDGNAEAAREAFAEAERSARVAEQVLDLCKAWRATEFPLQPIPVLVAPTPDVRTLARAIAPKAAAPAAGRRSTVGRRWTKVSPVLVTTRAVYQREILRLLYEAGAEVPQHRIGPRIREFMGGVLTDEDRKFSPGATCQRCIKAINNNLRHLSLHGLIEYKGQNVVLTDKGLTALSEAEKTS